MNDRAIVLDANILIRAVLGKRVRELLVENADRVQFFHPMWPTLTPVSTFPHCWKKRGIQSESAMAVLDALETIVLPLELVVYVDFKAQALQRIATRDADDWPVLACALTIGCPVWTEDADFFGTGVATWTTDRVELYLAV